MLYDFSSVTAESVTREAEAAVQRADALVAQVVTANQPPTFDATLRNLELAGAEISVGYGRGAFMAQVHPDAAVRDAGQAAEEKLTKWRGRRAVVGRAADAAAEEKRREGRVAVVCRDDVYRAVAGFAASDEAKQLSGERALL